MANRDVRIFVLGLVALSVIGCDKADAPVTQPAPASQPATKSSPAVLEIGGEPIEFAIIYLDISRDQDSLHLQLYGSDRADKPQSSFYFDISLDGDNPESIPGQVWRMAANTDPNVDTNESVGVFIASNTIRMEPKEMKAEFSGDYPNLTVTLTGVLLREGDEAKAVNLSGTFSVHARTK